MRARPFGGTGLSAWALLAAVFVAVAAGAEQAWLREMRRDLARIEQARRNQAELHRGVVEKWQRAGRTDALIAEYRSRRLDRPSDALTAYGLGYALAVREAPGDLAESETHLRDATTLDPAMSLAFFSLGGVLAQQGRQEEALVAYAQCARLDPTRVVAHYAIGEIHRARGEAAKALEAYEAALRNARQDWAAPHIGIGRLHSDAGRDDDAEREFAAALRVDAAAAAAYFGLAQVRARQGREPEAMELYRRGAEHGGESPEALQGIGRAFLARERWTPAEEAFRKALALRTAASLRFDLGEALWAEQRREEAAAEYRQAAEQDAAYAGIFTRRADAALSATPPAPEAARAFLDKALAVNPDDLDAHLLYARIHRDAGDNENALHHYVRAAAIAPGRAETHFAMGDLHFEQGDLDQARVAYRQGIAASPSEAGRFAAAGQAAFDAGADGDAAAAYRKHLLLAAEDVTARYRLARSLEALGRSDEAIREYEHVRRAAPATGDALMRLSALYTARRDFEKSLEVLEQVSALEPGNAEAHFRRGVLLRDMGRTDPAREAFAEATKRAPDHVEAHYQWALLEEGRDADAAIALLRRVVELAPDRPTPHFRLAALLLGRGEEEAVIGLLTTGLELEPLRSKERYTLALLLDKRDRTADALAHYARATAAKPDESVWQYDYGRAAHRVSATVEDSAEKARLVEAADGAYSAAIALSPTADAHYHRGLLRAEHKHVGERVFLSSEIAEDFQRALALRPDDADARFHLARTYLQMEATDLAGATLRELLRLNPRYPGANAELGALAEEARNYDTAIEHYRKELTADARSARAHYRLGFLYANAKGDLGLGEEHLRKALALDATNVNAHIEYGRVLYQLDRLTAAADQFERALKLDPRNLTANYNLAVIYQYLDRPRLAAERWRFLLTLDVPGEWAAEARQHLRQLEQRR